MIIKRFFAFGLALTAFSCHAKQPAPDISQFKTDCVGHFNIKLPDEAELALVRSKEFTYYKKNQSWDFKNGDTAKYSSGLRVSEKIDKQEFLSFREKMYLKYKKEHQSYKKNHPEELYDESIHVSEVNKKESIFFDGVEMVDAFVHRADRMYVFFTSSEENSTAMKKIKELIPRLRTRTTFQLPSTNPSVCIPYGYLTQDTYEEPYIGITYRLQSNPEIEIMLREGAFESKRTEEEELRLFWDYYDRYKLETIEGRKYEAIDGRKHGFQDVTIAGYKGKEIYVEFTRKEQKKNYFKFRDNLTKEEEKKSIKPRVKDYGYAAVVKTTDKHPNNPNLLLYITRNSHRAKGESMSEEEFKSLIAGVVQSIQKR